MSATRFDYIATSKAIQNARDPREPAANQACDKIARELAQHFAQGNPKFCGVTFLRAAGVKGDKA